MPICNLTIQLVVANLYTIFEVSNLNGCGDIFDEKSGEKEKKNVEKNKKEKDHLQSHDTTCRCEPVYQIWSFYLKRLWRYLWRKIWRERKKKKFREEQIGEGPFSIPRYNLSLWICIPNLKFLFLMVVEISLTKNLERKKNKRTIVVLYRSPETLLPIIWAWRTSWLSNHNLFS